ncbi:DUF6730 family protein [Arenibacter troitsensis]|uniref:Uncharacterized protein n=1 Tax=Arenibacter troitsensis TaxID=188872 RepID=A0A1X7IXF6_9FLAO|nr:DUF6730 family protein [Arenibacter troitsensis]SMG19597.1 hypothetical protein SAMN03080602_01245 [Arenibacter troitsensis]
MGYKKLDEVMELLNDELDGFNKALEKLEKLTENVDNIKISPDTSKIEHMLKEHLNSERTKSERIQRSLQNLGQQISKARMVPKVQLWLQYGIWAIFLVIIGYLAFQVARIDRIRERSYSAGRQEVISDLKGYFDHYPEHYQTYKNWAKEKDSLPNHK